MAFALFTPPPRWKQSSQVRARAGTWGAGDARWAVRDPSEEETLEEAPSEDTSEVSPAPLTLRSEREVSPATHRLVRGPSRTRSSFFTLLSSENESASNAKPPLQPLPLQPSHAPSWACGDPERFAEDQNCRLRALAEYAGVCTFIAGFALADLGGIQWNFPPVLGELYVTLMAFAAGCTALNAGLGIMLVVAHERLKAWDVGNLRDYAKKGPFDRAIKVNSEGEVNHTVFVRMFGDPGDDMYTTRIFTLIYDSRNAPMHYSIQLFPWAIVSYLGAVVVNLLAAASGKTSSYYPQAAMVTIMTTFAVPIVYFGRRIMALVVA